MSDKVWFEVWWQIPLWALTELVKLAIALAIVLVVVYVMLRLNEWVLHPPLKPHQRAEQLVDLLYDDNVDLPD